MDDTVTSLPHLPSATITAFEQAGRPMSAWPLLPYLSRPAVQDEQPSPEPDQPA